MKETERERVFLVKRLPALEGIEPISIKVGDFHDPNRIDALKIKQKGDRFFLIKKEGESAHKRIEHQISITEGEFNTLWAATTQRHEKLRYIYPLGAYNIEVDLYQGSLAGYVRAEIEFASKDALTSFVAPDWFGQEITECNHDIHEDLGVIGFEDMRKRLLEKGIALRQVLLR